MKPSLRRLSLCWLALMLLLKAALPWLAVGAAQAQGKTLVEVCTVYGVKTVVLDGAGPGLGEASERGDSHPFDRATPGSDHCVLASVLAHAASGRLPVSSAQPSSVAGLPAPPVTAAPRAALDAAARWVVRQHHAPPVLI
jgi:hypothetical protein